MKLANLAAAVIASLFSMPLHAQTWGGMQDLGTLSGNISRAYGVSANGAVVVGDGGGPAFRWTSATGMQDIGTLGGSSRAYGVNANGTVVVGDSFAGIYRRAFRWTAPTGMQDIGTLGGAWSVAYGVNDGGSVVVGESRDAVGQARAFRWTATTGMQDLGSFGGTDSKALGVNGNGSVVVGGAFTANGWMNDQWRAFRWTAATGMQNLGTLGGTYSEAAGVSADGSVVVGLATNASNQGRAFRWTAAGGMQDLGTLGGGESVAEGVSADGSVVVGYARLANANRHAFRWTAAGGMQDLGTIGGNGSFAFGTNGDGSVVVGQAEIPMQASTHAFRWELGVPVPLGTRYCQAIPNSTGLSATIDAEGSNALAGNYIRLTAARLPAQSFGYFLTSTQQGNLYPAANTQGRVCLSGSIGRYVGPGQVKNSGPLGAFSLAIEPTTMPTPTGFVAWGPGETWNFQCWHRDVNPTLTSNFTDAVSITFP